MSAKDKKSQVFSHFKKDKGEFLCQVEENIDVCGATLATKPFSLKRHFERHHYDIFKRVAETDEAKTSQNTARNALSEKETLSKNFPCKN